MITFRQCNGKVVCEKQAAVIHQIETIRKMKLALVLCFLAVAYSAPFKPELDVHWENFKQVFGKSYSVEEEGGIRLIWEQNVARIFNHNLEHDLGKHGYTLGLNEYADLSNNEFVILMNGYKLVKRIRGLFTFLPPSNVELPSTVDWRKQGMVTPVKNQQQCGSCWAFSTTGSVEGQHKKKTGKLVSLSEQNLVDCCKSEGSMRCNSMDQGFEYIIKNGGIDTEDSYPLDGLYGPCRFNKSAIGATIKGYVDVNSGDESALQKAVATVGPVSVAIDASSINFQLYSGGVYDYPDCSTTELDHGVLVVGYGSEDGKDYWLVKNSWGKSWGLQGYIKMARNAGNLCGIATLASYPLA